MVTNYIKGASYKEVYDLHTDSESSSILTVHAPVTNLPRQMLGGFFDQYRRFKYRGCKVKLRPASRLPADPLQISYEAGEPTIDPRDMLNPILARGYCGDSLGYFLNYFNQPGVQQEVRQTTAGADRERIQGNGFFGSSIDKTSFPEVPLTTDPRAYYLEKLYYQSLSDPGFIKIRQQKGYSRFVYPLCYELATTTQKLAHDNHHVGQVTRPATNDSATVANSLKNMVNREYTSSDIGTDPNGTREREFMDGLVANTFATGYSGTIANSYNNVKVYRHTAPIITSRKRRLGWLDTDTVVGGLPYTSDETTPLGNAGVVDQSSSAYSTTLPIMSAPGYITHAPDKVDTVLPPINMMVFILPKAYKTEMYYRMEITHVFDFKDYRPLCGLVSPFDESSIAGASLEWNDWDDSTLVEPGPSITSTSKNFELVDVTAGDSLMDVGA